MALRLNTQKKGLTASPSVCQDDSMEANTGENIMRKIATKIYNQCQRSLFLLVNYIVLYAIYLAVFVQWARSLG